MDSSEMFRLFGDKDIQELQEKLNKLLIDLYVKEGCYSMYNIWMAIVALCEHERDQYKDLPHLKEVSEVWAARAVKIREFFETLK